MAIYDLQKEPSGLILVFRNAVLRVGEGGGTFKNKHASFKKFSPTRPSVFPK
jgi:hypothetical protein